MDRERGGHRFAVTELTRRIDIGHELGIVVGRDDAQHPCFDEWTEVDRFSLARVVTDAAAKDVLRLSGDEIGNRDRSFDRADDLRCPAAGIEADDRAGIEQYEWRFRHLAERSAYARKRKSQFKLDLLPDTVFRCLGLRLHGKSTLPRADTVGDEPFGKLTFGEMTSLVRLNGEDLVPNRETGQFRFVGRQVDKRLRFLRS